MTKFPHINVSLIGEDGNAFAILGRVLGELRRAKVSQEDRDAFIADAQSGDYNHLLQVVMETVNTDGDEDDEDDEDE